VFRAPLFLDIYPRLAAALDGRRVCVFNAAFDAGIVNQVCRAHKVAELADDWQCAMLAMADFLGEPSKYGRGYRWPKLGEACARFGIKPGTHRALADAQACRSLVVAMAAAGDGPNTVSVEIEAPPVQAALIG
jgi:DNA polymerase-3 subunit epsilon